MDKIDAAAGLSYGSDIRKNLRRENCHVMTHVAVEASGEDAHARWSVFVVNGHNLGTGAWGGL
jgi:hypothetical protein